MYEDLLEQALLDVEKKTNKNVGIIVAVLFNKSTNCFETAVLTTNDAYIKCIPQMLRETADNFSAVHKL
jgi:hypothetical protein